MFYRKFGAKRRKKMSKPKKFALFVMAFLSLSVFWVFHSYDKRLLPTAVEISEMKATAQIAAAVAESVERAVREEGLKAADFYEMTFDESGGVVALTVNSVLINGLCSTLSVDITDSLSSMPDEDVALPLGIMTGVRGLSNYGPKIPVKLQPLGMASVDYSSSFTSAGINQTNFKIWVQAEARLKIVNPVQDITVSAERKILIVDAIINGNVPSIDLRGK